MNIHHFYVLLTIAVVTLLPITLAKISAGPEQDWSWQAVAEPQCERCACMGRGLPYTDKTIQRILSKTHYEVVLTKLSRSIDSLLMTKRRPHHTFTKEVCYYTEYEFGKGGKFRTKVATGMGEPLIVRCKSSKMDQGRSATCSLAEVAGMSSLEGEDASMMQNLNLKGSMKISVIWTDGTTAISTGCFGKRGFTIYFVQSINRKLSRKTKEAVYAVLRNEGFDTTKSMQIDYSNCFKTNKNSSGL